MLANAIESQLGFRVTFVHTKDFSKYDPIVVIRDGNKKEVFTTGDVRKLPKMDDPSGVNHSIVQEAIKAIANTRSIPQDPPKMLVTTDAVMKELENSVPNAQMKTSVEPLSIRPIIEKSTPFSPSKSAVTAKPVGSAVKTNVIVADMDF